MFKKIFSVGAWTMLSRITGLARDIVMGAILGGGASAAAFVVAFKLPNSFRAIFAEGAFNAAFIPSYSTIRTQEGEEAAGRFAGKILSLLLVLQIVLLLIIIGLMPQVIELIAPGFVGDATRFDLAVTLSRITFPYLGLIVLTSLYSAILNSHDRFTAAAASPILLNLCMLAALGAWHYFPSAAHAAAWGVTISGVAQLALLLVAARRAGLLIVPGSLKPDGSVILFLKRFAPVTIGAMGAQIAMFVDTMIATLLPNDAVASLYYADRLYQLPIGVIGIAAGTVLLPEMSRHFAGGATDKAFASQNRAMMLTWLLCGPCLAAFVVLPDLIMQAVFVRGAFTSTNAGNAAIALLGYSVGLPAMVLIRSAVASFLSSGDTRTPMLISLTALAVNLALKLVLTGPLQQMGLTLATSIGAWLNLILLVVVAHRRGLMAADNQFLRTIALITAATIAMGIALWLLAPFAGRLTLGIPHVGRLAQLALTGVAGFAVYCVVIYAGGKLTRTPLRMRG